MKKTKSSDVQLTYTVETHLNQNMVTMTEKVLKNHLKSLSFNQLTKTIIHTASGTLDGHEAIKNLK